MKPSDAIDSFFIGMLTGIGILVTLKLCQDIYDLGYHQGRLRHVKKGIIEQGNILQYPFGTPRGETAQASDSHSPAESGQGPEAA